MLLDDTLKALTDNYTRLLASKPFEGPRTELAKRIGVGDGTLGRIMYGTANPAIDTLVQLAAYFRVEPWELLVPGNKARGVKDQPALNEAALAEAIEWVSRTLDDADLVLSKKKKAKAISLVYARLIQTGEKLRSADILEFVRKGA